jgi:hypothetical protein
VTGASGSVEGSRGAASIVAFVPDDATALELAQMAGLYVERGRALSVALDYSDASIQAAEEMGVQAYASLCRGLAGDELRQLQGTLVFELGAYVGETFIRNHGGCWGWATMPGNRAFGLRTGSGLTAFPLTKAKKRLLGNFGSLVAFYRLLVRWPETADMAVYSPGSGDSTSE